MGTTYGATNSILRNGKNGMEECYLLAKNRNKKWKPLKINSIKKKNLNVQNYTSDITL